MIAWIAEVELIEITIRSDKKDVNKSTYTLTRKICMECPLCDKIHDIEERKRTAIILIKDEEVEYEETYFYCCNSREDANEFETGKMMNVNMLNARNAYRRKKNLLTSDEIVEIRERYGLSQVELARLLGWGEATISRYESKAIQDEAYDNMLRIIKDNPLKVLEFLQKNQDKFTFSKRMQIREKIVKELDSSGKEFLSRQSLRSEYVLFSEPSDLNGNVVLNIDKVEGIVSYYADKVVNLYKTKLTKMLWYADAEFYKSYGRAITGLVYRHDKMGVLPIGWTQVMNLENIVVREEEDYESTKYYFYKNNKIDNSYLNKEELKVLDKVIEKFEFFTPEEFADYVYDEEAYCHTESGEIISFNLTKGIKAF